MVILVSGGVSPAGLEDPIKLPTQWYYHSTPDSGSFVIILHHTIVPQCLTSVAVQIADHLTVPPGVLISAIVDIYLIL